MPAKSCHSYRPFCPPPPLHAPPQRQVLLVAHVAQDVPHPGHVADWQPYGELVVGQQALKGLQQEAREGGGGGGAV
jgi:hypothetical protein